MTSHVGHGPAIELTNIPGSHTRPIDEAHLAKQVAAGVADVERDDLVEDETHSGVATMSTRQDAQGMRRMGRNQQLVRHYRLLSIASFVAIATAAWEFSLFLITPGLLDGGRAGVVWNCLWNFIGFGPIYISMAEMASMAPIAGAQYHWVSEFAPENCQRILSYLTGWTSTIAWQAGNALGIFLSGTLIQAMIVVNDESYVPANWQGTLLAIMSVVIAYVGNVYGSKILPYWQNGVFVVHVLTYLIFLVPVWVNAPRATHAQVWTEFDNSGGWSSIGVSVLIGQLTGISNQVGIDTAAHMAEEVKDAATSVPRAMIVVYIINMCLLFPAVLTICYHIPSIEDALNDTTTYPAIYVLRQAMSSAWVIVVLVIISLIIIASNVVYLAAVTRDLFAFARDQGLPFSGWISTVNRKRNVPVNAAILTSAISTLLSLIYIGSPVAFYAITSLSTVALLQCYCFSIGCCLWRRIAKPETMPPARFSLGRWGIPMNALAVLYSAWAFFWSFWPQAYPITAAGWNWASPIYSLVLIVSIIYFVFAARKNYVGPVALVEGRKLHSG